MSFLEAFGFINYVFTLGPFLRSLDFSEQNIDKIIYYYALVSNASPIVGGILADNFFGRFPVLVAHCMLFIGGFICTAFAAFPVSSLAADILALLGLVCIAFGVGINKTVLSTFLADQIPDERVEDRKLTFSYNVMIVNVAAMLTLFFASSLKDTISCFGGQCFFALFGLLVVCQTLSFALLLLGKRNFKMGKMQKGIVRDSLLCIWAAVTNVNARRDCDSGSLMDDTVSDEHDRSGSFLDRAYPSYSRRFISQVNQMFRASRMFVVAVGFWFVYNLQYTVYYRQWERVNNRFLYYFSLTSSMYFGFNAVFVVLLIWLVNGVVYPLLNKIVKLTSLRKIAIGGCFSILTILVALGIQITLDSNDLEAEIGNRGMLIFWEDPRVFRLSCQYSLSMEGGNGTVWNRQERTVLKKGMYYLSSNCSASPFSFPIDSKEARVLSVLPDLFAEGLEDDELPSVSRIRIIKSNPLSLVRVAPHKTEVIVYTPEEGSVYKKYSETNKPYNPTQTQLFTADFISSYKHTLRFGSDCNKTIEERRDCRLLVEVDLRDLNGARLTFVDRGSELRGEERWKAIIVVPGNSVHGAWMLLPLFLMACSEVLLGISGAEFAYEQTATPLKAIVQSLWLLMAVLACLLLLVVSLFHPTNMTMLLIGLAIMTALTLLFMWQARSYHYIDVWQLDKGAASDSFHSAHSSSSLLTSRSSDSDTFDLDNTQRPLDSIEM